MTRIVWSTFRPFKGDDGEYIALRVNHDARVVEELKTLNRLLRTKLTGRSEHAQAIGWLGQHKRWFVDPQVWAEVRFALAGTCEAEFLREDASVTPPGYQALTPAATPVVGVFADATATATLLVMPTNQIVRCPACQSEAVTVTGVGLAPVVRGDAAQPFCIRLDCACEHGCNFGLLLTQRETALRLSVTPPARQQSPVRA